MNPTVSRGAVFLLASVLMVAGCYQDSGTETQEAEGAEPTVTTEVEESYPDLGPEQAQEIERFVRAWVDERVGEGGVYDIPPRGEHDLSGTLTAFHTVHQQDDDTYYVCTDFEDGENTYDVDFYVNVTPEGSTITEHYLHKVDGQVVE